MRKMTLLSNFKQSQNRESILNIGRVNFHNPFTFACDSLVLETQNVTWLIFIYVSCGCFCGTKPHQIQKAWKSTKKIIPSELVSPLLDQPHEPHFLSYCIVLLYMPVLSFKLSACWQFARHLCFFWCLAWKYIPG